jgi:hypothetical protein
MRLDVSRPRRDGYRALATAGAIPGLSESAIRNNGRRWWRLLHKSGKQFRLMRLVHTVIYLDRADPEEARAAAAMARKGWRIQ